MSKAAISTSMANAMASMIRGLVPRTRRGSLSWVARCFAVEIRCMLDGSEVGLCLKSLLLGECLDCRIKLLGNTGDVIPDEYDADWS